MIIPLSQLRYRSTHTYFFSPGTFPEGGFVPPDQQQLLVELSLPHHSPASSLSPLIIPPGTGQHPHLAAAIKHTHTAIVLSFIPTYNFFTEALHHCLVSGRCWCKLSCLCKHCACSGKAFPRASSFLRWGCEKRQKVSEFEGG